MTLTKGNPSSFWFIFGGLVLFCLLCFSCCFSVFLLGCKRDEPQESQSQVEPEVAAPPAEPLVYVMPPSGRVEPEVAAPPAEPLVYVMPPSGRYGGMGVVSVRSWREVPVGPSYEGPTVEAYHRPGCDMLDTSAKLIKLSEAKASGFVECSLCRPPK